MREDKVIEKYKSLLAALSGLRSGLRESYSQGPVTHRELNEVKKHLKSLNSKIAGLFKELNRKIEDLEGRVYELEQNPRD